MIAAKTSRRLTVVRTRLGQLEVFEGLEVGQRLTPEEGVQSGLHLLMAALGCRTVGEVIERLQEMETAG